MGPLVDLAGLAANVALGLETALLPSNLLYCLIGVTVGMVVGVLPGIGTLATLSLLIPLTFHLHPVAGIMMLAGIYYGSAYGGSIAAILLNVPGAPSSVITSLDGFPMARQGRAGVALFITSIGSFVGGSIGIILMMLFSPIIARAAISFGSAEYFLLMVLGLIAASSISQGSAVKGMAMVVLGVTLGLVGTDLNSGIERFTFGFWPLIDGISVVALAMGLFGVPEVVTSVRPLKDSRLEAKSITLRSMLPTREDARRSVLPILRGSAIGSFFGILPGTGGFIASFMAYAVERKVARDPSRFGKGAIEGVASPEAANNAADQTSFIPTLTLGIPGSAPVAIIMGVMIIHGIQPGPQILQTRPDVFWGLVMSFWIGNLILLVMNIPLIGIWLRLLTIPYNLLYPAIVLFLCVGVYSISNTVYDIWILLFFGMVGYGLRLLAFPAPPLLMGFVLGPMMEQHFRRALLISDGDFSTFVEGPINITILTMMAAALAWVGLGAMRPLLQRRFAARHRAEETG